MTRKDYIKFADMIKKKKEQLKELENLETYKGEWLEGSTLTLDYIVDNMIEIFKADNFKFNTTRFLEYIGE